MGLRHARKHLAAYAEQAGASAELRRALEAAGRELEPALDQISGAWKEPRSGGSEAQAEWEPGGGGRPDPAGRLVSTLRAGSLPAARTQIAPVRSPEAAIPSLTLVTGSDDEDEPVGPVGRDDEGDDRPLHVILDAIEDETDVWITYAGADGGGGRWRSALPAWDHGDAIA